MPDWKSGDRVQVIHEREYWINSATGQLVVNWRFEDPQKATPGFDDSFPWPGPAAILARQHGGGNGRRWPKRWYDKLKEMNPPLIWRDENKPGGLTWLSWYLFNYKPNREWYPAGGFLSDNPDPYPLGESLTSWSNVHVVIEVGTISTRIKAYRYKDPVPDVLDPLMCAKMYSIDKEGNMAWMGSEVPILVEEEAWIPNEKLIKYEEPAVTNLPIIRDISRHQGIYDMQIAKDNGVQLVLMRSTISYAYRDPFYINNLANADAINMETAPYHVLYPGESPLDQADNWYAVQPPKEGVPRVLDAELQHGLEDEAVGESILRISEIVKSRDGYNPLQYSRRYLLSAWQATWTTEEINQFYYHLAQYYSDGEEHGYADGSEIPDLPDRVTRDRVLLHQTSDVLPGFPGEAQSAAVDTNRGNGHFDTVEKMHSFIASEWGGGEPPPISDRFDEGKIVGWNDRGLNMADYIEMTNKEVINK